MFVPLLLDLGGPRIALKFFWYSGLIETNKQPICFAPDRTSSRIYWAVLKMWRKIWQSGLVTYPVSHLSRTY